MNSYKDAHAQTIKPVLIGSEVYSHHFLVLLLFPPTPTELERIYLKYTGNEIPWSYLGLFTLLSSQI
jgi:hypothetical protein